MRARLRRLAPPRLLSRLAGARRGEVVGLGRDTAFSSAAQGAALLAVMGQVALLTHGLGLRAFGQFSLVVAFVTLVQQFVDMRVEQATITVGARKLGNPRELAGVIQWSYLVDAVTGVLAFLLVVGLAPVVGPGLIGPRGPEYIVLFSLTLLSSTGDGTSLATLRLFHRFPTIAWYSVTIYIGQLAAVAVAVYAFHSLAGVFLALLAADILSACLNLFLAGSAYRSFADGMTLLRPALSSIRSDRRVLFKTIFHSNIVSYGRIAQTQLPALILGWVANPVTVALYKVGSAAGLAAGKITDPAWTAILPRFSRLWIADRRGDIRRLVRVGTAVAGVVSFTAAGVIVILREPILTALGGAHAKSAATVLIITAVAVAINGTLFWNGPLLWAAGRPGIPAAAQVISMVTQVTLLIVLTPALKENGAALAMLVSYVFLNLVMTTAALRVLRAPAVPHLKDLSEIEAALPLWSSERRSATPV